MCVFIVRMLEVSIVKRGCLKDMVIELNIKVKVFILRMEKIGYYGKKKILEFYNYYSWLIIV